MVEFDDVVKSKVAAGQALGEPTEGTVGGITVATVANVLEDAAFAPAVVAAGSGTFAQVADQVTVDDLDPATDLAGSELVPVFQDGELRRTTASDLAATGTEVATIPASVFTAANGSPTSTLLNRHRVWSLAENAVGAIGAEISGYIPADWLTFHVDLCWTNGGAGAGDAVWRVDHQVIGAGGAFASPTTGDTTDGKKTAPAQSVLAIDSINLPMTAPGTDLMTLLIHRVGSQGADTLENAALIYAVRLVKDS